MAHRAHVLVGTMLIGAIVLALMSHAQARDKKRINPALLPYVTAAPLQPVLEAAPQAPTGAVQASYASWIQGCAANSPRHAASASLLRKITALPPPPDYTLDRARASSSGNPSDFT
jgi:hypothetical protein